MPVLKIAIPMPCSRDDDYNELVLAKFKGCLGLDQAELVPIELGSKETALHLLSQCHGVILPGTPADIDPARYRSLPAPGIQPPDEPRDYTDEVLLHSAMDSGKPILGVCHGLQALNVVCGGQLIQRLPAQPINHAISEDHVTPHSIAVEPQTRMWKMLFGSTTNSSEVPVNSNHHQAILAPGADLRVAARSFDGVIEALEGVNESHFTLGVQWHPEGLHPNSLARRKVFEAFLAAARLFAP